MPTTSKSRTTTERRHAPFQVQRRLPSGRPPTHPGAMLLAEFLLPLGISQSDQGIVIRRTLYWVAVLQIVFRQPEKRRVVDD